MPRSTMTPEQSARAQEIYNIAKNKSLAERNAYLSTLTETERGYYKKEVNKELQRKFNRNPENVARYNLERKVNIARIRREQPEKMKEQNLKDVKAFVKGKRK